MSTRRDRIHELESLFEYVSSKDDMGGEDGFYQLKDVVRIDVESWQFKALFGENRGNADQDYVYSVLCTLDDTSDDFLNGEVAELRATIDQQPPLDTYTYHLLKWLNKASHSIEFIDEALDEAEIREFKSFYDLALAAQYLYMCEILKDVINAIDEKELDEDAEEVYKEQVHGYNMNLGV
jgi:hypothetical protein